MVNCYNPGDPMRPQILTTLFLASACLSMSFGCSSDGSDESTPVRDAAVDTEPDALVDAPVVEEDADVVEAGDAAEDVDAGPPPLVSCETPCADECATHGTIGGLCADCVGSVCAEHRSQALNAPGRDALFTCNDGCGSDNSCINDCCSSHAQACAFELAYELCTCGYQEDDCAAACTETCTSAGLTTACGTCTSQSVCTLATFDYLFAPDRGPHQDCVETCTSSSLTLEECLDRCRDDYPVPAAAYDDYLTCACAP